MYGVLYSVYDLVSAPDCAKKRGVVRIESVELLQRKPAVAAKTDEYFCTFLLNSLTEL